MKKYLISIGAVLLGSTLALAQSPTAKLTLSWGLTTPPVNPISATHIRIEEKIGNAWQEVAVVPASQTQYVITGRAQGQVYTFREVPVKDGVSGTPGAEHGCGLMLPNTIITTPMCVASPE